MKAELYLTPVPLKRANLEEKTVVVIDVLRSSTSICAALKAGARGVIPVEGPGEAGEMWTKIGPDITVLAGERNGVKIENFTLGNSLFEFTPESVGDRFVVLTTTNGTGIFARSQGAALTISCGLVNVSPAADRVAREGRDVAIICAGSEGSFSIEDTLCGGMLLHLLRERAGLAVDTNDAASLALLLYRDNRNNIRAAIERGEHGRFLARLGFGADVSASAQVDSLPVLPVLHEGRLVIDEPKTPTAE